MNGANDAASMTRDDREWNTAVASSLGLIEVVYAEDVVGGAVKFVSK